MDVVRYQTRLEPLAGCYHLALADQGTGAARPLGIIVAGLLRHPATRPAQALTCLRLRARFLILLLFTYGIRDESLARIVPDNPFAFPPSLAVSGIVLTCM
jgi:hypothetical protein